MSRDFQIGWPCSHIIGEERTQLSTDRMTLLTHKPIAGSGLLQVAINDVHPVSPSQGIQSQASLVSGKPEPYLVTPGLSDLVIRTQDRYLPLTLPTGYQTALSIATLINAAVGNPAESPYLIASVMDGVLVITENGTFGPSSQIRVVGGAVAGLGFLDQVGSVGQVVLPPFSLFSHTYRDAEGVFEEGYFIKFDRPVRSNCYFSVTYQVVWHQCLRCRGTEVENDFRFDANGQSRTITGDNLLYQSVLKILLTDLKSNIYYPWYGTNLMNLIGSKSTSASEVNIRQGIQQALAVFQNLQAQQSKYQRITPQERLYSVDHVGVK